MTYELIENINKIECKNCNLLSNTLINKDNKNYCPLCYEIIKRNQYNNMLDIILSENIIHQLTSSLDNNHKYITIGIIYLFIIFIINTLLMIIII